MFEKFRTGLFSDIMVKIHQETFECHEVILMAYSEVLHFQVVRERQNGIVGKLLLDISEFPCDSTIFGIILDFFYGVKSVTIVTLENALDLYCAAHFLQSQPLKDYIIEKVRELLDQDPNETPLELLGKIDKMLKKAPIFEDRLINNAFTTWLARKYRKLYASMQTESSNDRAICINTLKEAEHYVFIILASCEADRKKSLLVESIFDSSFVFEFIKTNPKFLRSRSKSDSSVIEKKSAKRFLREVPLTFFLNENIPLVEKTKLILFGTSTNTIEKHTVEFLFSYLITLDASNLEQEFNKLFEQVGENLDFLSSIFVNFLIEQESVTEQLYRLAAEQCIPWEKHGKVVLLLKKLVEGQKTDGPLDVEGFKSNLLFIDLRKLDETDLMLLMDTYPPCDQFSSDEECFYKKIARAAIALSTQNAEELKKVRVQGAASDGKSITRKRQRTDSSSENEDDKNIPGPSNTSPRINPILFNRSQAS